MGEEAGPAFLCTLRQACHRVDEANQICREMGENYGSLLGSSSLSFNSAFEGASTSGSLKLEIEFIWDIYRENHEDVLVIRTMRPRGLLSATSGGGSSPSCSSSTSELLHYWTYPRFRERLGAMRSIYAGRVDFCRGDCFSDPWSEPTAFADLQLKLDLQFPLALSDARKELQLKQLLIGGSRTFLGEIENFSGSGAGDLQPGGGGTSTSRGPVVVGAGAEQGSKVQGVRSPAQSWTQQQQQCSRLMTRKTSPRSRERTGENDGSGLRGGSSLRSKMLAGSVNRTPQGSARVPGVYCNFLFFRRSGSQYHGWHFRQ